MINIKNVSKSLAGKKILDNINLHVNKGSIFGLIGPNGTGKTTLIKCLTGIYNVDCGEIKVCDENIFENTNIKQKIGYVADYNNYFEEFKVEDIKKFFKLAYKDFDEQRFNNLNDLFEVSLNKNIKKLSKGMRTRLAIALNLSIKPKIMVMDEPTSGLDPIIRRKLLNVLLDEVAQRETTLFISSHNLGELERICDSIAIMDKGKIQYSNSIQQMKENIRKLQVVFKDEKPNDIENWDGIINIEKIGRVYNIVTNKYSDDIRKGIENSGVMFMEDIDLSLEDMFIYSMGGEKINEELFK